MHARMLARTRLYVCMRALFLHAFPHVEFMFLPIKPFTSSCDFGRNHAINHIDQTKVTTFECHTAFLYSLAAQNL